MNRSYLILATILASPALLASPQAAKHVDLGSAAHFAILAKSGISTTGTTSVLGDIADAAGKVAGAVEQATAVVDTLQALAKLGDLNISGGLLKPIEDAVGRIGKLGNAFKKAGASLASVFDA